MKEVVNSLTNDMSTEQMKETLLQAIDKRAKKKGSIHILISVM